MFGRRLFRLTELPLKGLVGFKVDSDAQIDDTRNGWVMGQSFFHPPPFVLLPWHLLNSGGICELGEFNR